MKFNLVEETTAFNAAGGPSFGKAYKIASIGADTFSVQVASTIDSSTGKTFLAAAVDIATDIITLTAHGYATGRIGQFSNPGTLPTGISAVTNYFIIRISADTFQIATTLALAQAGTAVDITDIGAGTNTFTPTALAGGSASLYQSNDNVTYVVLGSATSVTVAATFMLNADRPAAAWIKVGVLTTAGQINNSSIVIIKGDKGE